MAPTRRSTPPASAVLSSYTLTGTVTDPAGRSISRAVVSVIDPSPNLNAGKTTTADFAGRYTLSVWFSGFSLMVSAPGYVSTSRGIALPPDATAATADFALAPTPGISFDGLSTNGSVFETYTEGNFTVSRTVGDWMVRTTYGHPAPFIQFFYPSGPATSAEIVVTAGSSAFKFAAVDLYSSVTPIPFEISGFRRVGLVFRFAGTQGLTFGDFATIQNQASDALVDTLFIRLSNPAVPFGPNPMGVDNIRVSF